MRYVCAEETLLKNFPIFRQNIPILGLNILAGAVSDQKEHF
jgi:hypothetical protein